MHIFQICIPVIRVLFSKDGNQLEKFCVVHLFISNIFTIVKKRICGNRRRCVSGIRCILKKYRSEFNTIFCCSPLNYRNIFCVEWTLMGIIKDKSVRVRAGVSGAFFDSRFNCIRRERKIPQLDPVVCLIANRKTFVLQISGICEKRLFPGR